MTALIVIAVIVLIFAFFLNMKIRAEIKYIGGEFDFKVKYLWLTIYPFKEKKPQNDKKLKKVKKKSDKKSDVKTDLKDTESVSASSDDDDYGNDADGEDVKLTDEKSEKKKEKLSEKIDKLKDIIEKAKIIWSVSKKHLKKIFTRIYIDDLMIDFVVAGEDAYETAMTYGKISAVTYNAITALRMLFPITVKTVDIVCDFEKKEPVYDGEVKITIRPSTILSAGFGIIFGLLINIRKLLKKPESQSAAEAAVQ